MIASSSTPAPSQTDLPSVSVVMPTLNAERFLEECLGSLASQDYAGAIELVIADAGSTDRTLEIVQRHGARIVPNPLKSGEAGKAVGVKAATGDLVLLLDSDNTLIGTDWLTRMVRPFVEDPEVLFCEPARFGSQPDDHFIVRWHGLIGAADPITIYTGNYARNCALTGTWTGFPHTAEDRDGWMRVELDPAAVPVLGANGFMIRRSAYEVLPVGDYLFDLDYVHALVQRGHRVLGRPDVAVRHLFVDSVSRYRTKTRRRIDDFFFFADNGQRSYPWTGPSQTRQILRFIVSTLLVLPVARDAVRGYRSTGDAQAWAWHVASCWVTLGVYAIGTIRGKLRPRMLSRENWRQ